MGKAQARQSIDCQAQFIGEVAQQMPAHRLVRIAFLQWVADQVEGAQVVGLRCGQAGVVAYDIDACGAHGMHQRRAYFRMAVVVDVVAGIRRAQRRNQVQGHQNVADGARPAKGNAWAHVCRRAAVRRLAQARNAQVPVGIGRADPATRAQRPRERLAPVLEMLVRPGNDPARLVGVLVRFAPERGVRNRRVHRLQCVPDRVEVALLFIGEVGKFHPQLGPTALSADRFEQRRLRRSGIADGALASGLVQVREQPLVAVAGAHGDAPAIPGDRFGVTIAVAMRVGQIERNARAWVLGKFLLQDAQVAGVGALARAGGCVMEDDAVGEHQRRTAADGRVFVATPFEMDAQPGLPQPVMGPLRAAAGDLHAEHVVLAPKEGAAQIVRREQLVVGIHPQHVVRAALLDGGDEHVAGRREIPELPVTAIIAA